MDFKILLICVLLVIVGIMLMVKNKFYKHPANDMSFPAELKLFLSGVLLSLIGIYGIVSEILKII